MEKHDNVHMVIVCGVSSYSEILKEEKVWSSKYWVTTY
jgi:hypothetical protein